MTKLFREDAAESVFFNRQLEYIMPASFDIQYPDLMATQFVPVDSSAGPGAERITYRAYDKKGLAKIVSNYATDFPRAEVSGLEYTSPVKSIGAGFGYNIQEMRAAMQAASVLGGNSGRTLDQRRADAAMRALSELQDKLIRVGDTASNLTGFLNNSNVTSANAANPISSASTPDQIIAVLNHAVSDVVALTNGIEMPGNMLMPYAQYNYIASTARSANSDTTILKYFLQNNPYIKSVQPWWVLKGAASDLSDLLVVYSKDLQHVAAQIPQPIEIFPAEQRGLEWEVKMHARNGGTINFYPLGMSYLKQI